MPNRITYAILTLILNGYGSTSFMQGNVKKGIFTIVSGIITCGVVGIINEIKGIILGIKLLQMSDEDFAAADKSALEDAIVFFYKD